MITTATYSSWPFDTKITKYLECGLNKPSVVRFKLHTLDNHLIKEHLGKLAHVDRPRVIESFSNVFHELYLYDIPLPPPIKEFQL